jgi:hypothetical protein
MLEAGHLTLEAEGTTWCRLGSWAAGRLGRQNVHRWIGVLAHHSKILRGNCRMIESSSKFAFNVLMWVQ